MYFLGFFPFRPAVCAHGAPCSQWRICSGRRSALYGAHDTAGSMLRFRAHETAGSLRLAARARRFEAHDTRKSLLFEPQVRYVF